MGEEGTFIHKLHEEKEFDTDAYWVYYNSIREICLNKDQLSNVKTLDKMMFDVYSYFLRSTIWHLSPKDLSIIEKLPKEGFTHYIERLTTLISSSYFGEIVFEENSLDEEIFNPIYK